MPTNPALAPALISAGGNLASSAIGAYSTAKMNRKTMKWNEMMYNKQRADSLADYTMQNEYNSPTSQMARLREAGLNPNLVYGDGATQNAAPIRSTDVKPWNPEAPKFDVGRAVDAGIGAYYDTQAKTAQIDLLKKENQVKDEQIALTKAQVLATNANTIKTGVETQRGQFDLELNTALRDTSLQAAEANLNLTKKNIDVASANIVHTDASTKNLNASTSSIYTNQKINLDRNEREAALNSANISEALERILTMRAQRSKIPAEKAEIEARIKNLKTDTRIKSLEEELRKTGSSFNDASWQRILNLLLNGKIDGKANAERFKGTPFENTKMDDLLRQILSRPFDSPLDAF